MKIKIRNNKVKFTLWFPTSMVSNKMIWKMVVYHAKIEELPISEEALMIILAALKKCIKEYKGTVLVDVVSHKNEIVKIIL